MSYIRDCWSAVWRATIVSAIGPVVLTEGSLGESAAGDLVWLLALLMLMVAGITVLVRAVARGMDRTRVSAVVVTIVAALTLPLLLAGELAALLSSLGPPRLRVVLALDLIVGALLILRFVRGHAPPERFVSVVTIAAGLMVGLGVTRIGVAEWRLRRAVGASPTLSALRRWDADSAVRTVRATGRPDVFLFIMDAYAGDSLLLADYGVDHRAFRDSLAVLGFVPPERYRSNYRRTFASVASILNFSGVASVSGEPLGRLQHAGGLHALITDNRAARFFSSAGYDLHWFPAPFFGGRRLPPRAATVHRARGNVFWERWISGVLISTWVERYFVPGVLAAALDLRVSIAPAHYAGFPDLRVLAADGRPSFAVVHLFATHEPLVYDEACDPVPDAVARLGALGAYAAAVRCQDAALLRLFGELRAAGGDELIIAAVGDHAPNAPGFVEMSVPADSVPFDVAASRFDVGAFFLVPPRMRVRFHAPASGVNLMPALMNAAFDVPLPWSPDSLYYSQPRPSPIHRFVPISP